MLSMSLRSGLELRFHPSEKHFPSWYDDREDGPAHPCFLASSIYRSSADGEEYHSEAYQFYFKENLGIGLFGMAKKSQSLGYHKHDVEGIIVLFKKETQEPLWVYFKAHGRGQGEWKKWEDCEKTEDGALIVYIAWGSHATYSRGEKVPRVLWLANDAASRKGRRIRITHANYVAAERVEFAPGIIIYDTVQSIPEFSITKAERVLLPFVNDKLKRRARRE